MKSSLVTLLVSAFLAIAGGVACAADPQAAESSSIASMSQFDLLARLQRKDPDLVVLDVRTPAEFAAGHVPGARNVSHDQLAANLAELEPLRDKDVVLYCRSGRRTLLAEDVLRKAGFTKLLHLDGDYLAWEAQQRPVERESAPAQ
jgi:rhodanese-related sulfurtransferase